MSYKLNILLAFLFGSFLTLPWLAKAEKVAESDNAKASYAHQFIKLDRNENQYLAWSEIKNRDTLNHAEFMEADTDKDVRLNASEYAAAKAVELGEVLEKTNLE